MPRYSRLLDDDDPPINNGYIGYDDGLISDVGPVTDHLSYEPTSNNGSLRLTSINDVGLNEIDDDARETPCRFCSCYARFVNRFPVVFCLLLFAITAAGGAVALVMYDIPSFDDPLKGFQARGTYINDRTMGLSHFDDVRNDDHFHTLPRASKRSVVGNQVASGTPLSPSSSSPSISSPAKSTSHSNQDENNIPFLPRTPSPSTITLPDDTGQDGWTDGVGTTGCPSSYNEDPTDGGGWEPTVCIEPGDEENFQSHDYD